MDWNTLSMADIQTVLEVMGDDGHSIYPDTYLRERHINERVITAFDREWESHGGFKDQIDVNGKPVPLFRGTYGLTVLRSLAAHFNVSSDKLGRGFEASDLTAKIKRKLTDKSGQKAML